MIGLKQSFRLRYSNTHLKSRETLPLKVYLYQNFLKKLVGHKSKMGKRFIIRLRLRLFDFSGADQPTM